MNKTVLFRCDASTQIGSGHVMRCLTLADELNNNGWDCVFASESETLQTLPALANSGYKVISPDDLGAPVALLVVDNYGLDKEFETPCRKWADNILVLDDLADRSHDCDILLDQTYGRDAKDYKPLVPDHCRVLSGCDYSLLRPQFAANREKALLRRKERDGKVENLLVFIGGTDPHNITGKVLEGLSGVKSSLNVEVVMGAAAPHLKQIKNHINNDKHHNIRLHINVKDMASLMLKADLAIGAGGTTSWERCCLGLPSLIVVIADNQKFSSSELEKQKAVVSLGWHNDFLAKELSTVLKSFIEDPERSISMSHNASAICDGLGAVNLIEAVNRIIEK